jgi:cell division protein WhiA
MYNNQSFSQKVKEEISRLEYKRHCARALLSSYLKSNFFLSIENNSSRIGFKTQSPLIARFISFQLKKEFGCEIQIGNTEIQTINNKKNITVYIKNKIHEIKKTLKLLENGVSVNIDRLCCKKSYISGVFLSGGSVNNLSSSSYHLELQSSDPDIILMAQEILVNFHLDFKLRKRGNKYLTYVKKSSMVSDFLKIVSAKTCMFEYENKRMEKDIYNQIRKLNNIDISNYKKSLESSAKQIETLKKINFSMIKEDEKVYYKIRINNPEDGMKEIAKKMSKELKREVTKAQVAYLYKKMTKKISK